MGYVIQRVSGQPYASFIQQCILVPLHMNDTGFILPSPSQPAEALAIGYKAWQITAPPWVYDPPLAADMTFLYANGYLYSTAEDLQRWDQALSTLALVLQRSLDAMFTPYVAMPTYSTLYTTSFYGYGWEIAREGSLRVIWHGGWHVGSGLR